MKKALYAFIAITLIGGVAFGFSQSGLLKGNIGIAEVEDLEGNDGGSGGTMDPGIDTTTDDDGGVYMPGDIDLDIPGPGWGGGTTPSCDSEYYLDIYVETEDDENLSSIPESKFTIETSSGTDATSSFDFDNQGSGNYQFDYTGSSPSDSYEVIVDPNGYQSGTVSATINDTCSDVRFGYSIILDYNHSISVKDPSGDNISDATVKTGTSYGTSCSYWAEETKYLCATPDNNSENYQISKTAYVTEQGSFTTSASRSIWNSRLGFSSLLAAAYGPASYSAESLTETPSAKTQALDFGATLGLDSGTYDIDFGYALGLAGTHKAVTLDYAWTITVTDADSGDAITDASVAMSSGTSATCSHVEDGLYWCASSYSSSTSQYPRYTVTATGYDDASGSFTSTRTSATSAGVNQNVELTVLDTTDPASYCESVTISSDDLPLAYDEELGTITIDVEVSATSSDFESSIYTKVYSGDGTLTDTTSGESVYGSTDTYIHEEISGSTTTKSYTYSGGAIGDEILSTAAANCDNTFEITQDAAPAVDEAYELSCSAIDITPDSYEIYLEATSSTLHEFELSWTVIQQLVAVRTAPEWIQRSFAYKHQLNSVIQLATADTLDPLTFTLATMGGGSLYYESDLVTPHTSLTYDVSSAQSDTVTFYYTGATEGDTLYVSSSDLNCSDSLSLGMEEAEVVEEEEEVVEEEIDFSTIEDTDQCDEYPFTDVDDGDDMSPYIYCLAQAGAIQGYGDGTFGPNKYITNAELVKIVVAMTGKPLVSSSTSTDYIDIDGHWAERYIKTAESLDIARPSERIYFGPDDYATRGYLVVLLARAAGETLWGWDESDIPVSDATVNDFYTYALILAMEAEGEVPGVGEETIIQGYADNTFKGGNPIRRDEAAAMLIRAFYAWFL